MLVSSSGDPGRSIASGRLRLFARAALSVAVFPLLWLAEHRYGAWRRDRAATFQPLALGWFTFLLAVAAAAFCFAVAAFLPAGRVIFRPGRALMLALGPMLAVAHFAAPWILGWRLPSLLMRSYFYMGVGPQTFLAALVGVGSPPASRAGGATLPRRSPPVEPIDRRCASSPGGR